MTYVIAEPCVGIKDGDGSVQLAPIVSAPRGSRSMTPVTKPRWLHSEMPSARRTLNARGSRARPCPPRTIAYAQRGAGERKPGPVERR